MKQNRRSRTGLFTLFCCFLAAMLLSLFISASHALKPGEISITAEYGAGLRTIAAMEPDAKIRNPDYLAEKFLPPNFWFYGSLCKDYQKSKEFIKFYRFSAYYAVNAATFHIDGILKDMAAAKVPQVVIIGAGFDSRPYRFEKKMPDTRFFELDLPATQKRKKEVVKAEFGQLPESVVYIPINYRTQPVLDELQNAGYDKNQKTLFIYEGTQYCGREVVNRTIQSLAQNAAPGSQLVFGYIFDEVVQGNFNRYRGAWYASVRLNASGEPWKFGIAEGKAEEFVKKHGFKVISDLGAEELAKKYLVRSDGAIDGKPTPYMRIMHAEVNR